VLLLRALVGYPMLRATAFVVAALVATMGGNVSAAELDSPPAIVVLAVALAFVDIHRRGERVLWANLGYSPVVTCGLFGAVALVGESILALIFR